MAAIFDFCILKKMPKGATVAPGGYCSGGFDEHETAKKRCAPANARSTPPTAGLLDMTSLL